MLDFVKQNEADLAAFAEMSKIAGARADYVQGGGGNTSVKLADGLMAIKASGYCLSDITPDKAYAVLDYETICGFYTKNEPSSFSDVEKEGSACAKENTKVIDGLDAVRPSVEAGFHSIMKKFVLHTHSVYANLCCCSNEMEEIAAKAFDGADYSWGWVKYTDPGANLTFAIRDEIKKVAEKTGKEPAIILMQNHGIIAHADTAQEALSVHADANERLANAFGIRDDSFPKVSIKNGKADTPYLADALKSGAFDYKTLIEAPLYPDQMVFLIGTLFENKSDLADGECSVNFADGSVIFNMGDKKALTITETLTAVTFIMNTIKAKGYTLSTMGEAAKHFIANWESEKYRKSLAGGNKK